MKTRTFFATVVLVMFFVLLPCSGYSQEVTEVGIMTEGHEQSETAIAVDPLNSFHFMWTWNDFQHDASEPGFGFTTDGGETWIVNIVPDIEGPPDFDLGVDPSCAFDKFGNAFYCYMAQEVTVGTNAIYVSRTTDNGEAWNHSRVFYDGTKRNDKPYMAADNVSTDEQNGYLYVTWVDLFDNKIKFSRSTNQGESWSAPIDLDDVEGQGNPLGVLPDVFPKVQAPVPSVGYDGVLHVVWIFAASENPGMAEIRHRKSTDGGMSWTPKNTVATLTWISAYGIGGARLSNIPTLAADKEKGHVYVAYAHK